jgi:DnaJ-class molecular chaperone
VDSGDTIRVPEAGNSGPRGSQPGWLYIKLKAQFYSYIFPSNIILSLEVPMEICEIPSKLVSTVIKLCQ